MEIREKEGEPERKGDGVKEGVREAGCSTHARWDLRDSGGGGESSSRMPADQRGVCACACEKEEIDIKKREAE